MINVSTGQNPAPQFTPQISGFKLGFLASKSTTFALTSFREYSSEPQVLITENEKMKKQDLFHC